MLLSFGYSGVVQSEVRTPLFYPLVYVLAAGKRHYVICITLNCFFDVTKSAFVCYYERYRTFLSLSESA
jgi:hypothetical protein